MPVDVAWACDLDTFVRAAIAGLPAPDDLDDQAQGALAAGYHRDFGLLRFADGAPLGEVRTHFRRATEYMIAVFRARAPRAAWQRADNVDESMTNSWSGLEAMELALSCGAIDLAETLAPLVWDSPDATYVGPTSVVCTLDQQRLAYALRDLLTRQFESAAASALPDTEWRDPAQRARGWALVSIAARDGNALTMAVEALREEHSAAVRARLDQVPRLDRLDLLLDVPSLAYSALGRARLGYVPLPHADPSFPHELARDDP